MRLKNPLRLGKNSDDRFSDFMLSENLACEVVCAETNSVFAEEIWSERRKSCQNHHFETDVVYAEGGYYVIIRAHSQDDTILLSRKEKVPV